MKCQDALNLIRKDRKNLEEIGVESLSLFGSVARGEESPQSDVDVLVSFQKPVGFFEFVDLKEHLESLLKTKVDLVTQQALHRRLRQSILEDSIHAF